MTGLDQRRLTLSVEETAELLGIGRSLCYSLIARGEIPSLKLGKLRRVPVALLEEMLHGESVDQAIGRK